MKAAGEGSGLHGRNGRRLVIGLPYFWLALFFLVPFAIVLKVSFSEAMLGNPPFAPLLQTDADGMTALHLNIDNFLLMFDDSLYYGALLNSLQVAAIATVLCLLLGFPMAYGIARAAPRWRLPLLMLIILPFWTSFLIRVYAWIGILKPNGLLNEWLMGIGLIDQPLAILHTPVAVYIGIVYSYLPFMILPLYATLVRLDLTLLEAAADLGARPFTSFLRVTLPLAKPGIIAGCLLVFVPATGEFVIPDLLGGPNALMIGKVLWTEFFNNADWPVASAMAVLLLVLLVGPVVWLQRSQWDDADSDGERS
ncbi:MAG: ABC transporter permease subunit [Chromatiales bacterium]|nr:ABC transporter permease subunit [Gammaproteobacteria bacterium]MCP5230993.1 ABC transporter permease subunit [Zoogloeaceae bacterium]MCP5352300.1 ABC transporter permease subunit [Chromatiales bacterium]